MGGMGRVFDGGYAEYTVVPRSQVIPFTSDLPWEVIGAVPETLQTAYGSPDHRPGPASRPDPAGPRRHLLGRPAAVDHRQGPGRDRARHHPPARPRPGPRSTTASTTSIVDDGQIADRVRGPRARRRRRRSRAGRHARRCRDTLRATRVHGTVCFTGMLSNQWTVPDFYPIGYLPTRRPAHRLRRRQRRPARRGPAALPRPHRRRTTSLGPIRVHRLDDIRDAHDDLEHNRASASTSSSPARTTASGRDPPPDAGAGGQRAAE